MLWRRTRPIVPKHLAGLLLVVVTVYLCSVLAASDHSFLGKRFTVGFLRSSHLFQLVIAYAHVPKRCYQGDRRQILPHPAHLLARHLDHRLPARKLRPEPSLSDSSAQDASIKKVRSTT